MACADVHVAKRIKIDATHDAGGPLAASQMAELSQQLLAIVSASQQTDRDAAKDAPQTSGATDILRDLLGAQRTALDADAGAQTQTPHQRPHPAPMIGVGVQHP
jgi:hypothetical protein